MLEPIFNLNDVLLIITIAASLLLVMVQPILPAKKRDNRIFLAAFFLSLAATNIGVMLMWNEYIRTPAWANWIIPYGYTSAFLLKGPALYLYVASITDERFHWRRQHLWHLLAIFCTWPLLALFSIDVSALRFENLQHSPVRNWMAHALWYLLKLIPLCYFMAATLRVRRYQASLENHFSSVNGQSLQWLYTLTISFVFAALWSLMVSVFYDVLHIPMGITDNYVSFILLLALCYYSLTHAQHVTATNTDDNEPIAEAAQTKPLDALTRQILKGVEQDQLYLNPTINLEQFARAIGASPRDVSYTINKVFGKNFFEFINFYRIEAAKRLLEDATQQHLTILEILMGAGFNSKSSFQRFFKRFTGLSPTEYREHQAAKGI